MKPLLLIIPVVAGALIGGGVALAQGIGQAIQVRRQRKENRRIYEQTLADQERLQDEARKYDSPESQMSRYKTAGLNPHLIYGQGSSGNAFPVNPYPEQVAQEPNYGDTATKYIAAQQATAQTQYTQSRTVESGLKQQAIQIQNEIAKTNPMLNPNVAASVADMMEQVASTKAHEAYIMGTMTETGTTPMFRQIMAEVNAMEQKLGLNTADLQIKNRILESKDFENAMKQLQVNWLQNGEYNAEHIRQGLMLILSKMLGR